MDLNPTPRLCPTGKCNLANYCGSLLSRESHKNLGHAPFSDNLKTGPSQMRSELHSPFIPSTHDQHPLISWGCRNLYQDWEPRNPEASLPGHERHQNSCSFSWCPDIQTSALGTCHLVRGPQSVTEAALPSGSPCSGRLGKWEINIYFTRLFFFILAAPQQLMGS